MIKITHPSGSAEYISEAEYKLRAKLTQELHEVALMNLYDQTEEE